MFSAVMVALVSTSSSTSSGPSHAARIWSASLGPPATGDQPVKTTTRGRRGSASRAAARTHSTARGPIR